MKYHWIKNFAFLQVIQSIGLNSYHAVSLRKLQCGRCRNSPQADRLTLLVFADLGSGFLVWSSVWEPDRHSIHFHYVSRKMYQIFVLWHNLREGNESERSDDRVPRQSSKWENCFPDPRFLFLTHCPVFFLTHLDKCLLCPRMEHSGLWDSGRKAVLSGVLIRLSYDVD